MQSVLELGLAVSPTYSWQTPSKSLVELAADSSSDGDDSDDGGILHQARLIVESVIPESRAIYGLVI